MQFYRQFDPLDAFVTLDDAPRLRMPVRDGARQAFALRNGPVVNEQALAGERYGRPFLRQEERASLERLLDDRSTPVFSAQPRVDPVLKVSLAHAPVRYLLGRRRTQIAERLADQPALGAVDVYALPGSSYP
jgi:hypothetical protein